VSQRRKLGRGMVALQNPATKTVADGLSDALRIPLERAIDAGVPESALVIALVSQLYGMLAWRFGRSLEESAGLIAQAAQLVERLAKAEQLTPDAVPSAEQN